MGALRLEPPVLHNADGRATLRVCFQPWRVALRTEGTCELYVSCINRKNAA